MFFKRLTLSSRSLMAVGKKLLLSLSVFAIRQRKRLPDGSLVKRQLPGWFESLMILSALASAIVWCRWSCREGRADPEIRSAKRTNSLQGFAVLGWSVSIPHWDALRQNTFYGPCIESFQDCWWDPEFSQLSQMVQSLPGFLDLCLDVCSPSQVLGDVYAEVTWSCLLSPQGSHWS